MYLEKHNIPKETVLQKTDNSILLEFNIPETCDFFDGHFPQIHLIPAVAQIDMMTNLAREYLGTSRYILSAKRIKFTSPIFPNTDVHINISFDQEKNALIYKLTTKAEDKVYSSGTFVLAKE